MNMSEKDKNGKSILARCVVIYIAAALISSSVIPGLAALQTEGTVTVTINAPANVGETFDASINLDSITDFNSGQFDLSFDSSVVNVTAVESGYIDGTAIPAGEDLWGFIDNDTIRVLLEVPGIIGVSGSGNLANISFEVKGEGGDKSVLDISKGILYNNQAEKITAEWIDDEVIVAQVREDKTPTLIPGVTPLPTATPDVKPTPKPTVPGFEAIFAIAVMSAIACVLLRRGRGKEECEE